MSIVAKDSGGDFKPAPAGLHPSVCVDVVDLGMVDGQFGTKHKVRIVWQIEEEDDETGKRFIVSQMYTLSLNEKAKLRHHLEAWRSRPFNAEELKGFDLEKLIGVNAQVQVVHATKDSKTYANVAAVVPLAKGMNKMTVKDYVRVKDRAKDNGGPTDDDEIEGEEAPF